MSFNRSQRRSETFRAGEPEDHKRGVDHVVRFLGYHWDRIFPALPSVHAPLNLVFDEDWRLANKVDYRIHSYDLGAKLYGKPVLIAEIGAIGDNSKHNPGHSAQLIKDGVAQRYIEEKFPECRFYRINKEDALNDHYLAEILWSEQNK